MIDDFAALLAGISLISTGVALVATCIAIAAARTSRRALKELKGTRQQMDRFERRAELRAERGPALRRAGPRYHRRVG